jgi:hypothetical protein
MAIEEILKKRREIPLLLTKLSYSDEGLSIKYLRIWGERRMQTSPLYQELVEIVRQKGL